MTLTNLSISSAKFTKIYAAQAVALEMNIVSWTTSGGTLMFMDLEFMRTQ